MDATVNIQPEDTLIEELAQEKFRSERLLREKEEEIRQLKTEVAAKRQRSPWSKKEPSTKERPPSSTSDDTSISESKLGLPQRKIRPLLSFAAVDSDDSASEAFSAHSSRIRRPVCNKDNCVFNQLSGYL